MIRFADRKDAGNKLSRALKKYAGERTIIYALPRGGVVVGFVVAQALKAPLDLVITRKIGHPQNPEYAVCAITEAGELFCNEAEKAALDPIWLARQAEQEKREARRRRKVYLGNTQPLSATDKIAIVVDDGIATGLTMRAALRSLRRERPKKLIAAIPVAPAETARALRRDADEVIVLQEDENYLGAVGAYYDDFSQTGDAEVVELIKSLNH